MWMAISLPIKPVINLKEKPELFLRGRITKGGCKYARSVCTNEHRWGHDMFECHVETYANHKTGFHWNVFALGCFME